MTGYVYDAEGRRVQKVVVEGWNTPHPQTVVENEYLLGLNNEQISVLNGTGQWQWTNVYAGGRQLATYDSAGTHFALTDWLGTKRVELNVTGVSTVAIGEQCQSLPFGDGLSCTGTDVNQLHFTGKQHDTESGNDYFLARYYASGMAARFLTPDWSKNPQGVPYANYADPQSLDLYSYMRDNPLSGVDADGHQELGAAPPCQQKGSNGCENHATEFKKKAAKRLAGFKAKALKFLGRHRKSVKAVNHAIMIGTAISGLADIGTSEVAVPLEAAGEATLESAIGSETEGAAADVASGAEANEGTYEFTSSSGKVYVGQSGDIDARIAQHLASGKLLPADLATIRRTEVLGGKTAREIAEQLRINQLGGVKNLENIRNPIGPARQYLLPNQ